MIAATITARMLAALCALGTGGAIMLCLCILGPHILRLRVLYDLGTLLDRTLAVPALYICGLARNTPGSGILALRSCGLPMRLRLIGANTLGACILGACSSGTVALPVLILFVLVLDICHNRIRLNLIIIPSRPPTGKELQADSAKVICLIREFCCI